MRLQTRSVHNDIERADKSKCTECIHQILIGQSGASDNVQKAEGRKCMEPRAAMHLSNNMTLKAGDIHQGKHTNACDSERHLKRSIDVVESWV